MKVLSVGAELNQADRQTDRQTCKTLIGVFRNLSKSA